METLLGEARSLTNYKVSYATLDGLSNVFVELKSYFCYNKKRKKVGTSNQMVCEVELCMGLKWRSSLMV